MPGMSDVFSSRQTENMTLNKTYTPELIPRQGDINAWLLAVAAAAGLYFLSLRSALPFWAWFFVALLAFSAFSISFGNWMDRKTFIRIDDRGVAYENGLRKSYLTWDMIREIRTAPARWGTSVQVIGQQSHFAFSTLGKMQFQGQERGRTGFAEGDEIFDSLVSAAGLTAMLTSGQFSTYSRP